MRRGRPWVGVLASALVVLSGAVAQAAPAQEAPASGVVAAEGAQDVAGAMHVLPARRVLDTGSGLGATKGTRTSGSTTTVAVLDRGGVPASGVGAVVLHLTVTHPTGTGNLTAYPGGTTLPGLATLHVTAGENISNTALVPVGDDGTVSLRYTGTGSVNMVGDVAGWTTAGVPTQPGMTGTLPPTRLMDTRSGLGGKTGALASGGLAHLQVTGRGGVPEQAGSVTLNVTVLSPTSAGWLAVTPVDPGAALQTSSVSFVAGQVVSNAVTTALSPTGTIDLRLAKGTSTHVAVDVVGWTVAGTPTDDGAVVAAAPRLLLDTRTSGARPPTGGVVELTTTGSAGVLLNVTAVGAAAAGQVTVAKVGGGTPNATQLSFPAVAARAALVLVPVAPGGEVRLTLPSSGAHLVVTQVGTVLGTSDVESSPAALTSFGDMPPGPTGTRLGWTYPAGTTSSVVVRRVQRGVPLSPFNGTLVATAQPPTTELADRTAQPYVQYGYMAYARDAGGNWSEGVSASAAGASLVWQGGNEVSPARGRPSGVSCPTTTWCMAVDESGQALTWSNGHWASPTMVAPRDDLNNNWSGFRDVSCPTTDFCLATTMTNHLATWRSGTWTVTETASGFGEVSCWSRSSCALTLFEGNGTHADFVRWTNGTLSGRVNVGVGSGSPDSLECPSSTCYLGRSKYSPMSSRVYRITTSGVTSRTLTTAYADRTAVSCPTATTCMAAAGDRFMTLSGTTWSKTRHLAQENGIDVTIDDLSCSSASSCFAVGMAFAKVGVGRWNGHTWAISTIGDGVNTQRRIDCASSRACIVVDQRGRYNRWNGSTWSSRSTFDNSRGSVTDLDCTSSSTCFATDQSGNLLTWEGGSSWGRTAISEHASRLDCAGSFCMTVGRIDTSYRTVTAGVVSGTHWDAKYALGGESLVCASSRSCFAPLGTHYDRWDGKRWTTRSLPVDIGDGYELLGDCPSSTFCLVVNTRTHRAITWDGSRWRNRGTVPVKDEIGGLDCTSSSFCMVAGQSSMSLFTGSSFRRIGPPDDFVYSVACRSSTHCLALVGLQLWSWDGIGWSATPQTFGDHIESDAHLKCVGTSRCVVFSGNRAWWTS